MLVNRVKQTATQDSNCHERFRCENCSWKVIMWAFNSVTKCYLLSSLQNSWLYKLYICHNKRKGFTAKSFRTWSLTFSRLLNADGVSWWVKIGLHQFDNCLNQVSINVTRDNNSCFSLYSSSQASSRLSAAQCQGTQEHVRQSDFLPVASPLLSDIKVLSPQTQQ